MIIILLGLLSLYLYLNKNNGMKQVEDIASYPTTVSESENTKKEINFVLDTPAMIFKPEKTILVAKSNIDFNYELQVTKTHASIKGKDLEIHIFTNMGESAGLYKSVSIESEIEHNLEGKIFKVKTAYENLNENIMENLYKNYYFYSSNFKSKVDCGGLDYDGCGGTSLSINKSEYENYSFSIFCGVNDSSLVLQCDEFVKNLDVKIEKVHNIVAFSLEYLNPKDNSLSDKNIELNAYYTDGMTLTDSKPNYVILRRFDFAIMLLTSPEETSFKETSVLENTEIADNKLNEQIFRVKSFDQFTNEFKELFYQNYINYYFYTSDFKTNDACGNEQIKSCGSKSVEAWEEHPLRIYCASNTTEGVSECDKFVKDLAVKN